MNECPPRLLDLIRELCELPHEVEWVEFKANYRVPADIGAYISALANATALRYIREAVDACMIKPFDEDAAPKLRKYVPYWVGVPVAG